MIVSFHVQRCGAFHADVIVGGEESHKMSKIDDVRTIVMEDILERQVYEVEQYKTHPHSNHQQRSKLVVMIERNKDRNEDPIHDDHRYIAPANTIVFESEFVLAIVLALGTLEH